MDGFGGRVGLHNHQNNDCFGISTGFLQQRRVGYSNGGGKWSSKRLSVGGDFHSGRRRVSCVVRR